MTVFQYFRGYEIPATMRHLWRYLRDAYDTPAFSETLPIDDDLCKFHWVRFPDTTLSEFRKQGIKGNLSQLSCLTGKNNLQIFDRLAEIWHIQDLLLKNFSS